MGLGGGIEFTAESLYGATPQAPSAVAAPTQPMGFEAGGAGSAVRELVNPHNPLFWFGVVLAITVGAAGFAGSGRVGSVKLSGEVGKS